jgi:hypothetical protein
MRGHAIRIIVLLWLGWYLSGPLAATIDRWDGPREETHDIEFNAGGGVVLIAAVFCFAILLAKKFRERFLSPFRNVWEAVAPDLVFARLGIYLLANLDCSHSPPFPIRI